MPAKRKVTSTDPGLWGASSSQRRSTGWFKPEFYRLRGLKDSESQPRKELVSQYHITEAGLKNLIKDLLRFDSCELNRAIIINALNGFYSESYPTQCETKLILLASDFLTLSEVEDPRYSDLYDKLMNNEYKHKHPPEFKDHTSTNKL